METPTADPQEQKRLRGLYEELRLRLLDLSRKNQLLNYNLKPRSKRFLQIVDCSLEGAYKRLAVDEATLTIFSLPEPATIPEDERTGEFRTAFERAKTVDIEYLTKLEATESTGRDDEMAIEKLERELRDRVRVDLGLPPRPNRKEINRVEHARSLGIDPSLELYPKNGKSNEGSLRTLKFPDELEALMEKINSDARLAEQEMGLSTLFIAFGFLEWYESDTSDKKSFAPLLLLPVQIARHRVTGKLSFSLTLREGGAEANLSLQKLLEQKYGRKLPDFSSDEDDGDSVEDYIERVKKAVDGLKRWQVRRWLVLGHFSFGRFAMYSDLEPERWKNPLAHPLVRSILSGAEQNRDGEELPRVPDDYEIDDPKIENIAPYLIHDADASQHSALIDVMNGKNLIVQGPPGTGKSQTITNVIANALAAGWRVLFLAEKNAALEVVKRRLDQAKLGDFCLELHSDKASPKSIVSSIEARYAAGVGHKPPRAQPADVSWLRSRDEISAYVRALHVETRDGSTPFELIWMALRGRTTLGDRAVALKDVKIGSDLVTGASRSAVVEDDLSIYASVASSFSRMYGHPAKSPWNSMPLPDLPPYEADRFIASLETLRTASIQRKQANAHCNEIGITNFKSFLVFEELAAKLPEAQSIDIASMAHVDLGDLAKALEVQAELLKAQEDLSLFSGLRFEEPERLAVAAVHERSRVSEEFLDRTPAESYEFAVSEIKTLTELAETIEAVRPVLNILGLGSDAPAKHLPTAACAACALGMAPPRIGRWIAELRDASSVDITAAAGRWERLGETEAMWVARLSSYRPEARPEPSFLLSTAAVLRKSGIEKLIASVSGTLKSARSIADQLGSKVGPDILEELAKHVVAIRAFEADDQLARLFGSAWKGLSTPLNEVLDAVRVRELIIRAVKPQPGADEIVRCLMDTTPDQMSLLSPHSEACRRVISLPMEIHRRLSDEPVERFIVSLRKRVAHLTAFLKVDPSRLIETIEAPIRRIANAHSAVNRAKRICDSLATYKTASLASTLGVSGEARNAAFKAIDWVRIVRSAALKPELVEALLSERAAATLNEFLCAAAEWNTAEEAYNLARVVMANFGAEAICDLPPDELIPLIEEVSSRGEELSEFLSFRQVRRRLEAAGLTNFLAVCDSLSVESERLPEIFAAILADRKAASARRVEELRSASGSALESRRRTFRDRDIAKILADRTFIREKLLEPVPPVGSNYGHRKSWTDMRLLANEFGKEKRFAPVRQLLSRAGRAIQTLKPCFMMSPLSLAKFVPAGSLSFDLVVIDEASQMRPEDALGGLLRARQVVVVGDAKQLPPTDFFARGDNQADDGIDGNLDDVDAESILEACEKTFGARRRLKWHYRSRCESLIAFSNREFYDDTLISFPMSRPASFSVELVRVDGTYRGQCNPAEAARVAEEAISFMRHFAYARDDQLQTLLVVAVNIQQRDFIKEEIRRLSAGDEMVENYVERVGLRGEPFDVKNLENVQGDERDHIFISMTYGKKHGEKSLAQNFGPINRKQGHRRLNVLFTRARVRVGLFTSFGSADIRPTEASSSGVRALKAYLEYAETKGRALAHVPTGIPDSDFEIEVADRLRLRGYTIDLQVGVSRREEKGKSFRIDLGVRHPDHPEHYLAGVECDGATYHLSKSARDRDRLREEVLANLGWQLVRVWSTDWFDNPARETDKLVAKLEELRKRAPSVFSTYPALYQSPASIPTNTQIGDAPEPDAQPATGESPTATTESQNRAFEGMLLIEGTKRLTQRQAMNALEAFREKVIAPDSEDWEPERSILRPAMIETFVKQKIVDPADWYVRIPQFLRSGTNPAEKACYLERICAIVERIGENGSAALH